MNMAVIGTGMTASSIANMERYIRICVRVDKLSLSLLDSGFWLASAVWQVNPLTSELS